MFGFGCAGIGILVNGIFDKFRLFDPFERLEISHRGLADLVRVEVSIGPVADGANGRDGAEGDATEEVCRNLDSDFLEQLLEGCQRKFLDYDAASGADGDIAEERCCTVAEKAPDHGFATEHGKLAVGTGDVGD